MPFKQLLVAKSFAAYLIFLVRKNQWLKETKCFCVAQYLTMVVKIFIHLKSATT